MKKIILITVGTLINVAIFQGLLCCPLNINSYLMWIQCIFEVAIIFFAFKIDEGVEYVALVAMVSILASFVFAGLFGMLYAPIFSLPDYQTGAKILESINVEFDANQVQLIDKDSAEKLGDRIFGTIGQEKVSQFKVGEYTQSVYNGKLVRIAPIEFGGMFSYFNNKATPGYIIVDVKIGESQVVEAEMKILESSMFGDDLYRRLFFYNMTYKYGKVSFELDEEGNPYYIVPVIKDHFGKLKDVKSVLTVNVKNGEITEYGVDEAPEWIDNVYPVSISYSKYNRNMKYVNGLFNFAKKGVVQLTEDYSYLQVDGTLYFYSGVTSVSNDESNIGYVYVNCHTGEFHYTESFGAEEFSARASAEGVLQEKGYTSVFPTLVTLNGEEVYFMALKDNAGLIKAYALVSYKDYQKAVVGSTVEEAARNYVGNSFSVEKDTGEKETRNLIISKISHVVINGNTIVVIEDSEGRIHSYDMSKGDLRVALLQEGEEIEVVEYTTLEILSMK